MTSNLDSNDMDSWIIYSYDDYGFVKSERMEEIGDIKEYTNDVNGNRKSFTLKKDNTVVSTASYTYDKLDRPTRVSFGNGVTGVSYTYNANGQVLTETGTNNVRYTYNKAGLVTAMSNSQGPDYTYSYRLDGNQISKSTGNETTAYVYDHLGQLKSETVTGVESQTTTYTYDSRGNRIGQNRGGIISAYTYDANNRLLSQSDANGSKVTDYRYDDNGNLIFKGISANIEANNQQESVSLSVAGEGPAQSAENAMAVFYTYNSRNQLTNVQTDDGLNADYTYDATGRRTSKTVNGVTTKHIWDGQNIVRETDGNDEEIAAYYRAAKLIAQKAGSAVDYYVYDAHGSVTATTNGRSYTYDAFGNETVGSNTGYNPFRYCGEYTDAETGLIYLRNRYYDPNTGRFTQEDPAKDGLNWYVYCGNNPVMLIDPSGLASIIFVSDGMRDQAEVRRQIYKEMYNTTTYVVTVYGAKDFAKSWNYWFTDLLANEPINAIEIISHGGATGDVGKSDDGTAYATGFLYFTDDPNNNRLFARDSEHMNNTDASISWLDSIKNKKVDQFNINGCNSANPDVYNIVYGFMQQVDSYNYTGFDGGAKWDSNEKDHVRGNGEYGTTWRHPIDPTYYVRKYQETWWRYVEKNNDGSPSRERTGRRWFH